MVYINYWQKKRFLRKFRRLESNGEHVFVHKPFVCASAFISVLLIQWFLLEKIWRHGGMFASLNCLISRSMIFHFQILSLLISLVCPVAFRSSIFGLPFLFVYLVSFFTFVFCFFFACYCIVCASTFFCIVRVGNVWCSGFKQVGTF